MKDFFNPYVHGFVRLAVATPLVRVGDPQYNLDATLELMQSAAREKVLLAVFPELGLSAYSCEDLFHQQALLDGAQDALQSLLLETRKLRLAALVGRYVYLVGMPSKSGVGRPRSGGPRPLCHRHLRTAPGRGRQQCSRAGGYRYLSETLDANLFAPLRVGADGTLYQLRADPKKGVRIAGYTLFA